MPPMTPDGRTFAGMFETIYDPETDLTFRLLNGTGRTYRYSVTGPGASGTIEVPRELTRKPYALSQLAFEQGVVRRQAFFPAMPL